MNVLVLLGGPSAEHKVSLVSGSAVIKGLEAAGHTVTGSDIGPGNLTALDRPYDVIFPVLHGAFGESGELQQIMEARGLCFVGSGSAASAIGIDKVRTKQVCEQAGVLTAPYCELHAATYAGGGPLGVEAPCVVKAIDSGSSLDVYLCRTEASARSAVEKVLAGHERCLVERYIVGTEVTVGILHERALPPIRIATTHEFFDYEAKYEGNSATHHFDTGLPAEAVQRVQAQALKAHQAVGARDLSRLDFIVDAEHRAWLLEINTMPGFTPKSLLPEAAAHTGISFPALVDSLVQAAWKRRGR